MQSDSGNIQDRYKSVGGAAEGLFKDRGSRFISYIYPVTSESQVKPLVDAIKKEHHAARHHCYAYRIGYDGAQMRANDDGEPSGSAGRPILGAIDSAGLSDVLIVVVRYFGGILLGVPGLINAYREASRDAIAQTSIVEKVACSTFCVEFDYMQMNDVQKYLKASDVEVTGQAFDLACSMNVRVPLSRAGSFAEGIERMNRERGLNITINKV